MPKNLVIVESPTKARTLQRFLGKDYIVEASIGHINNLALGQAGGPVAGIDENFEPVWELEYGAAARINNLNTIARDCKEIYLAADPDREGEGIAYHVANELIAKNQPKEKFKRVVFHEITEKAVKEAFEHAGKINMDLVNAHITRRMIDRLVGFGLSGLTSSRLRTKRLSVGRVQTVAVSIVKDKEDEIKAFIPEEYWNIDAEFSNNSKESYIGRLFKAPNVSEKDFKVKNAREAEEIKNKVNNLDFHIESVKTTKRTSKPRAPFTTSSLQQEASFRVRFSPSRTMTLAQQLFRGINLEGGEEGLITYMRTDSTVLSQDSMSDIEKHVKNAFGENYFKLRKYTTKSANAQEAHEAIRPTSISRTPESIQNYLDKDQYKLYELIWKRAVASQMSDSVNEKTTVITSSSDDTEDSFRFKSESDKLIFDGFKKLVPEKENGQLPQLKEGSKVQLESINNKQKFTQHPSRYTEASLIKALEDLGIGRPSTYASILSRIKDKIYIWVIGRSIYLTPIGNVLVDELKKHFSGSFMDYEFTAKMEETLDLISNGKSENFINDFWNEEYQRAMSFKSLIERFEKKTEEEPLNPKNFNYLKTNIVCSAKTPCINSITKKEFEEHDEPVTFDSDAKSSNMIWIRFRNKKGDGAFLACEDRECKVTGEEDAWAATGKRRQRSLKKLQTTMHEKSLHG